jgi:hypothetical protein
VLPHWKRRSCTTYRPRWNIGSRLPGLASMSPLGGRRAGVKMGWVARRRRRVLGRWRPWISLAPGPEQKGRALSLRARRSAFRFPPSPRATPRPALRRGEEAVGATGPAGPGRRAGGDPGAGRRDRRGQGVGHGLHARAAPGQGGRAGDHGVGGCRHYHRDHGAGRPSGLPGDPAGRGGVHVGLLATVCVPAPSPRVARVAGQRPGRQAGPGSAQDRQAGCGVAVQAERAGHAAALVHPARGDPPAAGPDPAAGGPHRGALPAQATGGAGCWRTR